MLTLPNNITGILPRPLTAQSFRAVEMCLTQRVFWGFKDESGKHVKAAREQSEKPCLLVFTECSSNFLWILYFFILKPRLYSPCALRCQRICQYLDWKDPEVPLKSSLQCVGTSELQRTTIWTVSWGLRLKLFMTVTPSDLSRKPRFGFQLIRLKQSPDLSFIFPATEN